MGDETRLAIIRSLFDHAKCGTELAEELNLPQPQIAHHLGILRQAGLVEPNRVGQRVDYQLHPVVYESMRENQENALDLGCCRISFEK
jgi:ArsR family transcriptional regulator